MKHSILRPILLLAATALAAASATAAASPSRAEDRDWQRVMAATARYHSLEKAEAAGYSIEGEPCVEEAPGAMGIHAVNRSLTMDQSVDPERPEILLYLPKDNGNLELLGVEYLMVALANTPDGPAPWFGSQPPDGGFVTPRPAMFGQAFDGPMPGHNPTMPWHYDLHAWLWRDNPAGTFAAFNPSVSCPG